MSEYDAKTHRIRPTSEVQLYVANRPAAKWPPPSDWVHRSVIRKLYLDEGRALRDVKAIMADKYKHQGTEFDEYIKHVAQDL
jgi:Clr5 domain